MKTTWCSDCSDWSIFWPNVQPRAEVQLPAVFTGASAGLGCYDLPSNKEVFCYGWQQLRPPTLTHG